MKTLKGISAAPGIIQGTVCVYDTEIEGVVPHYNIDANQVKNEVKRLTEAFDQAKKEMSGMIEDARSVFDEKAAEVFNSHLVILKDQGLFDKMADLIKERMINAEHAVSDIFDYYIKKYEKQEGHFKELTHDLLDTRTRILSAFNLGSGHFMCPIGEQKAVVVAAKQLTPSMILNIPKEHALAFVAKEGGFTSHATILARSYGVPIIFGLDIEKELECGTEVIVDGSLGKVIICPDDNTRQYYRAKIDKINQKKLVCDATSTISKTNARKLKDVKLKLNISVPEEIDMVSEFTHDGIGLLRTEFLFAKDEKPPSEEEQYREYRHILTAVKEPVTVRILDLSNDKLPPFLEFPKGISPDMEVRGAMAVELFRELFITQFKALLRANVNNNLRLLYPMVADLNDLNVYKSTLEEAKTILKKEKAGFNDKNIKTGVMIETPSAAMMISELIREVDFVNIGSNDLFQYTLATTRKNYLTEKRYHILHPALVKLMSIIANEGKKAKKEVCLCGEIASFEEFYPLFLELGIRSFSVAVSKFMDLQCEFLHIKDIKNKNIAKSYYKTRSKEEADSYFAKFI
ncbi:MAG: phosphoenolpyruvate--protein phosphotransferase [Elusimicrobia bacterium]|nr:phosphoenolpyruvate--protein phosphotransferase [Candidatus Liberimonas magnetica]